MYRTKAVRLNKPDFRILRNNSSFLVLTLLFVIGLIAGAVSLGRSDLLFHRIETDVSAFLTIRTDGNFWQIFLDSAIAVLPYPLLCFVCGTSVVGCALSPMILVYKGFFYGASTGYLYSVYALRGVAFNALIILPGALIAGFALILSAREALGFSALLARMCIKGSKTTNLYHDFKNYCGRHLILLVPFAVSVILDAGMSMIFMKFFNF